MKPTIGRIVHFHQPHRPGHDAGPYAAIVMAADGNTATLWVLFPAPGSPREIAGVTNDPDAPHYWAWPPREA